MTRHETLVLDRTFAAAPAQLWRAWTDPEARAAWASPAPHVRVEFLRADCLPGGREVSICRAPGMEDIRAEMLWHIVAPPERTLSTETISHQDRALSVALVTAEVTADKDGSRLVLTVQLASLGEDMAKGYRQGFSAALDTIAAWLADRARDARQRSEQ